MSDVLPMMGLLGGASAVFVGLLFWIARDLVRAPRDRVTPAE